MKQFLPKSIEDLSEALCRLPGIGPKTANRLTFYLLNRPESEVMSIGQAFINLKKNLSQCSVCFTVSEVDPCPICADTSGRDHSKVMVVEETLDMVAMERAGFDGVYHVLGGVISPINGVGPHDLTIAQLAKRVEIGSIVEVILATDPSLEGEATAVYVTDTLHRLVPKLTITRIAHGLPVGGDLEYADEMTLRRALEGRQGYKTAR